MAKIPDQAQSSLQGFYPAWLSTCSKDGVPNVTVVSQVYCIADDELALSWQFFSKTARNIAENPKMQIWTICPKTFDQWCFDATFVRSEKEGSLFEDMEMKLEAIASMTGMQDVFKLRSAEVYKVDRVVHVPVFSKLEVQ